MKHILLNRLHFFPIKTAKQTISGYSYNSKSGAWISENGRYLVDSPEILLIGSKKCDQETGEDKKGE